MYLAVVNETTATSTVIQTNDNSRVFMEDENPGTQSYYVTAAKEVFLFRWCDLHPSTASDKRNWPTVNLPVGKSLQDHANVSVVWTCPKKDRVNAFLSNPLLLVGELFEYLVWGTGLFLMPAAQPIVWIVSSMIDKKEKMLKEHA
ncbi:hypothetical protein DL96DRAFT_1800396 [Flagelloscypha sp. PMI_526]|nr:hypothetical protein DL96DRAFT_1800396 [Flagelloscypha sp. PMI_526]